MTSIRVSINNQQDFVEVDQQRVINAIQLVLTGHAITSADVSVGIVDDPRMHVLNRVHLGHDNPTDVLSFVYEATSNTIDGELIVSAETARRAGAEHGLATPDELLLYIVHGTLHLLGYDDQTNESQCEMRAGESHFLKQLGINLPERNYGGEKGQEIAS